MAHVAVDRPTPKAHYEGILQTCGNHLRSSARTEAPITVTHRDDLGKRDARGCPRCVPESPHRP